MVIDKSTRHTWRKSAEAAINSHRQKFDQELLRIRKFIDANRLEEAAIFAQATALYAWYNHTGQYVSEPLENMLMEIGKLKFPLKGINRVRKSSVISKPLKILHVLTESYTLGGHTRLVWRWMNADHGNNHVIAITGQISGVPLPEQLRAAVAKDCCHVFSAMTPLLERASQLRELAYDADMIVIHTHPHDVIPLIALANGMNMPPVLINNHADHTFWLGVKIGNVVMNLRKHGEAVTQRWRGVSAKHTAITPLPLVDIQREQTRADAKKSLGLPANAKLLLSIASQYKYAKVTEELDFSTVPLPLVLKDPDIYLFVIGVNENRRWRKSRIASGGRFRTVAATPDIKTYLEAADIYLDSFPFGSLTSLLEAGQYGVPVCGMVYGDEFCGVLRGEDPAIEATFQRPTSAHSWRNTIQHLLDNPLLRDDLGKTTRHEIDRVHTGEGWLKSIEATYQQVLNTPRISDLNINFEPFSTAGLLLQAFHRNGKQEQNWPSVLARHLHLLPFHYRLRSRGQIFFLLKTIAKRSTFVRRLLHR